MPKYAPKFTLTHLQDLYPTHVSNRECILLFNYISSIASRKIMKVAKLWFHMVLCPFVFQHAQGISLSHFPEPKLLSYSFTSEKFHAQMCTQILLHNSLYQQNYYVKCVQLQKSKAVSLKRVIYFLGNSNDYDEYTLSSGMWECVVQ